MILSKVCHIEYIWKKREDIDLHTELSVVSSRNNILRQHLDTEYAFLGWYNILVNLFLMLSWQGVTAYKKVAKVRNKKMITNNGTKRTITLLKKWRINKQQSTIQFTETWRLSNMNPMKTTVLVQGLRKNQQLYVYNWSWHPFLMAKLKSIQSCMLKNFFSF